jgi:Tol biopolymer transport system component/DNA-binding winged helix-turn-helix (wHTH) protein
LQGDFSIGDWHVQPQINRIHRGQVSIHLEPKVMQVLVLLASTPGEPVAKERLLQTVWSGVFVGDDVLTRAISEIRRVLTDDARSPHIIQTIPKTGYCLIAPVSFETPENISGGAERFAATEKPAAEISELEPVAVEEPPVAPSRSFAVAAPEREIGVPLRRRFRRFSPTGWIVGICLVIVAAAVWRLWQRPHSGGNAAEYRTVPFTSYPGSEGQPAFSPDGNEIAFVWNGETNRNKGIYVKILGTANPVRLTNGADDDASPAWSPDGRYIAFIGHAEGQSSIYVVPAVGGPERRIRVLEDKAYWDYAGVTWSGDGKQLIFPDRLSPQDSSSLFSVSLDTLETRRLTTPTPSWDGDWSPVVSPDGKKLAFVRGPESAVRDLYVMDISGGEPHRLTHDGRLIVGLTWTTDSSSVVFSSNRDGQFSLWQVPASGGTPARLAAGGENAYSPAIARKGNLLAYTHGTGKWNLLRLDLQSSARGAAEEPILSSNEQDSAPQYSPDGSHIAFQSWRSGAQEIWVSSADGSAPLQLTSSGGTLTGNPRWSPDGRRIAFDSRPDGRAHIYMVGADGGVPQALTTGQYNDSFPSWSPDGKWVYFDSNRSGSWQIWRISSAGGQPTQITDHGGMAAIPSFDNQWIYFTKPGLPGLWRTPAGGKGEQQILKSPPDGFQGYFALTGQGIYFFDQEKAAWSIDFVSFSSLGHITRIHAITVGHEPTPVSGLSISPDGRWLVYSSMAEASSNITLVENFR